MTATVTRGGPAAGNVAAPGTPARPPARRRWPRFPRASTTPGKVAYRQRYQRDIAAATADLKAVTAASGGVVLPLAMAAGCAWGPSRRLAEYR